MRVTCKFPPPADVGLVRAIWRIVSSNLGATLIGGMIGWGR